MGNTIETTGEGNIIVNESKVKNAFNRIKKDYDD